MLEREEEIGFTEEEEQSWRRYFLDFREMIWPMLEKEGFTYVQALMFWRQEVLTGQIAQLREELRGNQEG